MDYVSVRNEERVAVVTLDRPDRLNALGSELVGELIDTFRRLHRDRPSPRGRARPLLRHRRPPRGSPLRRRRA
jgi:enoyl-CoA hydratase/carnithine racemase